MEKVTGIGGVFFKARDPEALTRWYAEQLGVDPPPTSYDGPVWRPAGGSTVWAAMTEDSEHFQRPEQRWAINFKVRDLDAMVAQLEHGGTEVQVHAETYPNGRFADLTDPEGNPVQLWEPGGVDAD